MLNTYLLLVLVLPFNLVEGAKEMDPMEDFILDIIKTWNLLSPTIIVKADMHDFCMRHERVFCMIDDQNATEVAQHLSILYQGRQQDGIIILGNQIHEPLMRQVTGMVPGILTSNCPVFMPLGYSNIMKLRLDSNIIFFEEEALHKYELVDKFSVKNGLPITVKLGNWVMGGGFNLQNSMNRWERRTDLRGATFLTGVYSLAIIKAMADGKDVGSKGYFPEKLFYMTDKLNLTMINVETPRKKGTLLRNGSWTGCFGMLQRGEIDIDSRGRGIENIPLVYYSTPAYRVPRVFITSIPEGAAPNMWVYVRVFELRQWSIYLAALVMVFMGMYLLHAMDSKGTFKSFGTKRGNQHQYELKSACSYIALVYLFTIQMGSHTSTNHTSTRMLTLTLSMLTLLIFAYYTTDITAEMTSAPPKIPVRNFEDIIHHGYRVILSSSYLESILAGAKPGSAMHIVYKTYIEPKETLMTMSEAFEEVINHPKTLYYNCKCAMANMKAKPYQGKLVALHVDDVGDAMSSFVLPSDSEFLPLFNYYLLKAHEHGIEKRIYKKHHMAFFTNQQFGMTEALPLGYKNVMFTFICLGIGICVSLLIASIERMKLSLVSLT